MELERTFSKSKLISHGSSASSHPHSIFWLPPSSLSTLLTYSLDAIYNIHGHGNQVVYASNCIINIATNVINSIRECHIPRDEFRRTFQNRSGLMNVNTTLRTSTLSLHKDKENRIITCLSYVPIIRLGIKRENTNECLLNVFGVHTTIACAFSDGTITLWTRGYPGNKWTEDVIFGRTSTSTMDQKSDPPIIIDKTLNNEVVSIIDIKGVRFINAGCKHTTLLTTASSSGLYLYMHRTSNCKVNKKTYFTRIGKYSCYSLQIQPFTFRQNDEDRCIGEEKVTKFLLLSGTSSFHSNKIHVYTVDLYNDFLEKFKNDNTDREILGVIVEHHGYLSGHLDWITCLSILPISNGGFLLASGSKDTNIRLWRFHTSYSHSCTKEIKDGTILRSKPNMTALDFTIQYFNNLKKIDITEKNKINQEDVRLFICMPTNWMLITLEALLSGHDEAVTGLSWRNTEYIYKGVEHEKFQMRKNSEDSASLVSSSMDRSILIWMCGSSHASHISEEGVYNGINNTGIDDNVTLRYRLSEITNSCAWVSVSCVGYAGGILGGSVGSSLLGFVDVSFSPDGTHLMAHGYGGSLHFWSSESPPHTNNSWDVSIHLGSDCEDASESVLKKTQLELACRERWISGPCVTGHFRGVSDISWEVTCGQYLLSVGLDQTCRLWAPIVVSSSSSYVEGKSNIVWKEVGRPQVHGYDLTSVCCIGLGPEMCPRYVSAADEKVIRIFDAPLSTTELLRTLGITAASNSKMKGEFGYSNTSKRAYMQPLGLSNVSTFFNIMEENDVTYTGKSSTGKSVASKSTSSLGNIIESLPRERDLGVVMLWPEVAKLYGHHMEVVCLTYVSLSESSTNDKGKDLIASSCKARNIENAVIRIWDVNKAACIQILKGGHRSTITSLSFSRNGHYLASSGKDRRLCLWLNQEEGIKFELKYAVDSAHSRIIWCVDFCLFTDMSKISLASGSRDGYIKIWNITYKDNVFKEENSSSVLREFCKFEPVCKGGSKLKPVTAVSFAPSETTIIHKYDKRPGFALAIGTECGMIEIWHVQFGLLVNKQDSNISSVCTLVHSIDNNDCHVSAVKKLAWKPILPKEISKRGYTIFTLASCSLDNGIRLFSIELGLNCH